MNLDFAGIVQALATFSKRGHEALWDFGSVYARVRDLPDFNYTQATRAAKDQYGVDLIPNDVATKVGTAFVAFHDRGQIPLDALRGYSPYSCYEVTRHTDITPKNAAHYLQLVGTLTRHDLLTQLAGEHGKPPPADVRNIAIDTNVAELMKQARGILAEAVGQDSISPTAFIEFTSTLVIDSTMENIRNIWRRMHGDEED